MQNLKSDRVVFAGFITRLFAYIIDLLIVGIILLIVKIPAFVINITAGETFLTMPVVYDFSIYDILLYVAGQLYFIFMTYYTGSTLGKKVLKIRVVASDKRRLGFWTVVFRETIGRYLSEIILFVGYIMMIPDKEKRTLADHLADTRVVYSDVVPIEYVKKIM
ncbi:MAG: RDD family protein [Lachnospiraceae bacterium]|nr:RDD family protein [Lachnospiraceae bacterium]